MAIFMFSLAGSRRSQLHRQVYVFYAAIDAGNHAPTGDHGDWLYVGAVWRDHQRRVDVLLLVDHQDLYFDPRQRPWIARRHGAQRARVRDRPITLLSPSPPSSALLSAGPPPPRIRLVRDADGNEAGRAGAVARDPDDRAKA